MIDDYRNFKREVLSWLATPGKDPEKDDLSTACVVPSTVAQCFHTQNYNPTIQPVFMDNRLKNLTSRRKFLSTCGVVGSVGLAGCMGSETGLSDSGTDSQTPKEFAEEYMNALDQGDHEKIQYLTHSEGDTPMAEDIAEWGAYTFEISKISVQSQTEERATVQVVSVFETSVGAKSVTDELQLRKENGNWRAYSGRRIPSGEEIQDKIKRIQSEIEDRQEEINYRQNEINELQTLIEERRDDIQNIEDRSDDRVERIRNEIQEIEQEITRHKNEISSLEDDRQEEINDRQNEINELQTEIEERRDVIQNIEDRSDDRVERIRNEIQDIEQEITQHKDEISSLEDEISQRETEIENLREQLDNKG